MVWERWFFIYVKGRVLQGVGEMIHYLCKGEGALWCERDGLLSM